MKKKRANKPWWKQFLFDGYDTYCPACYICGKAIESEKDLANYPVPDQFGDYHEEPIHRDCIKEAPAYDAEMENIHSLAEASGVNPDDVA